MEWIVRLCIKVSPQESEEDVTKRREEELATLEEQINNTLLLPPCLPLPLSFLPTYLTYTVI